MDAALDAASESADATADAQLPGDRRCGVRKPILPVGAHPPIQQLRAIVLQLER